MHDFAVRVSEADVLAGLKTLRESGSGPMGIENVSIAAVNGPKSLVLSGPKPAVDVVLAKLQLAGRALQVSHAFHSPLMSGAADKLKAVVESMKLEAPSIPVVTNVSGKLVTLGELQSGTHWADHLLGAVRFADGMSTLRGLGCEVFLEIGPEPTLIKMGRQCVSDARDLTWVFSLEKKSAPLTSFMAALNAISEKGGGKKEVAFKEGPLAGLGTVRNLYKRQSFPWVSPTDVWAQRGALQGASNVPQMSGPIAEKGLTLEESRFVVFACLRDAGQNTVDVKDETLLMDMQIDSLSAVAFITEISARLQPYNVVLPSDFLFTHPSIGDIAQAISTLTNDAIKTSKEQNSRGDAAQDDYLHFGRSDTLGGDLENLPHEKEAPRASSGLIVLYLIAMLYISTILMFSGWIVLSNVYLLGKRYPNPLAVLVIAPMAKFAFNTIFICLTVASKTLFLGNVKPGESIPIGSVRYVQYWMINRLLCFANILCLGELKRTRFINMFYRAMGATIGRNVVIDTVGITDPDVVTIHDGTIVGTGVLLLGHTYKNGVIHFGKIAVGRYCTLEPRAVLQPGARVEHFCIIDALSLVGKNLMPSPRKSPRKELTIEELRQLQRTASFETLGHVAVMYLTYMISALSILAVTLFTGLAFGGARQSGVAACMAALQLTSGMYLPFAPLFVGAKRHYIYRGLWLVMERFGIVSVLWVFAMLYIAYAVTHLALCVTLKWILIQKWRPGTVPEGSFKAWRKFFSDTLLEFSFRQSASLALGTSFINLWLRLLGARIGTKACIRVCNGILDLPDCYRDPDLIDIGRDTHVGDRAALVTAITTASEAGPTTYYGPVKLGKHCLVGMGSVVLPGGELPENSGLGAISRVSQSDNLQSGKMHMGNPRPKPLYHIPPEAFKNRRFSIAEWILYALAPFVQPFVITSVVAFGAYFGCYATMAPFWNKTPEYAAYLCSPIIYMGYGLVLLILAVIMKWALVWKIKPNTKADKVATYGWFYYKWNLIMMIISIIHLQFSELIRGSPFYTLYMRCMGLNIGKDVLLEAVAIPDLDLVTLGDRSAVDQHVILCSHSFEAPYLTRQELVIGKDCVLRSTCTTLPGFAMEDGAMLDSLQVGLKGMTLGAQEVE